MKPRVAKSLLDILLAIDDIESFVANVASLTEYESDLMLQSAVERKLAIVGEALNRIMKILPDVAITDKSKIIGFRNIIIHNYDELDHAIVWNAVHEKLPTLKSEVRTLLNSK